MNKLLITSILSSLIIGSIAFSSQAYNAEHQTNVEQNIDDLETILNNYKNNKVQLEAEWTKLQDICLLLGIDTSSGIPTLEDINVALDAYASNLTDGELRVLLVNLLGMYGYDSDFLSDYDVEGLKIELSNSMENSIADSNELMGILDYVDSKGYELFGEEWDYNTDTTSKINVILSQLENNQNGLLENLTRANEEIDKANAEIQRLEGIIESYEADMQDAVEETEQLIEEHADMLVME